MGEQFVAMPLIGHLPGVWPGKYNRRGKISRFVFLNDHAREIVSDPEIGLALIHLPIPHPPSIYNRASGAFRTVESGSYLDDVVLADRELGILRRAMEDAGLWDRSAVLVSADHGWRTAMWRGTSEWISEDEAASHQETMGVPFLLKLPSRSAGVIYSERFNTVATRRLIIDILKGDLTDPAAVAAAIESAGSG
jgi:arylsulfatase A-like enzyme